MKKFNLAFATAAVMLFSVGVNAQDAQNPWAISVGAHAVDHTSVRGMFDEFFNVDDYSIVPPLSKLSVSRHLGGKFIVDLTGSVGEVDNKRMFINDELFINAGLGLRYRILGTSQKSYWFDPYLRVGGSYHRYDYEGINIDKDDPSTYVPVEPGTGAEDTPNRSIIHEDFEGKKDYLMVQGGLGFNVWLTDNFGINIESDYNMAPGEDTDYVNFFQHSAGVIFKFGSKDTDGDGINDSDDACPETPGLEEFNGCPDTDGDGIQDSEDDCPDVFGVAEYNGCPEPEKIVEEVVDTDGDGIADDVDDCPNVAGAASTTPGCNGCPDSDGDGVCDNQDPCPGDPNDECELLKIQDNVENVLFEYNSSEIQGASKTVLDNAATVLTNPSYSKLNWIVEGHTDSKGSAKYNEKLSQERADAVKSYLSSKGLSSDRIKSVGLGESLPIRPNDTEDGRKYNRRVEFVPADSNFKPVALTLDDDVLAKVLNKLSKKIYFQTGSANLVETSKVNLDRIAGYLNKSGKAWEVGGHTDNVGSDETNMKLSQKRAQSVVDYLVSQGVDSSKLSAKGYGETSPVDSNDTKEGRANNRRIEFK